MLKPHQLEIFYYVTKYGGISAASRSIPYSLGQPAISTQMTGLERHLGKRLFERKPFRLTETGRILYDYIKPMHDGLESLEQLLKGETRQPVCLAAEGVLGPEFLPAVLTAAAARQPNTLWDFRSGSPEKLEVWLRERQVHLAIATADGRIPGLRAQVLARPGLQLLVHRSSKITSPGHFWRQKCIAERLIIIGESGAVQRSFARGLQALHVKWPVGLHVDSTAGMLNLVAAGHGVGLSLELLPLPPHTPVRALPLSAFDPVSLVALWRQPVQPWHDSLLAELHAIVRKQWPKKV